MTKKALLIGINYPGTQSSLRGCANDCVTSIGILKKHFGFRDSNIRFLTDATDVRGDHSPTKANILKYMKWLAQDAKPGDQLFFHYSGHGSQVRDTDGDEQDGKDEVLCPSDYSRRGFITDDQIFDILIKPLPRGCKLFSIMDCCHSGTIMDLKYSFSPEKHRREISQTGNKECDAHVVMISGCRDEQTSADAFIGGAYAGAMTTAFATCLSQWFQVHRRFPKYKKLINLMYDYVRDNRYSQRPQINCSHKMDLDEKLDI